MNHTEYVAALDIGTSKIVAMAARKDAIGTLSILASEKIESEGCVLRGRIYNVDETREKIKVLMADLNNQLINKSEATVEKIYAGIGGQSLRTKLFTTGLSVNGLITRDLLCSLRENCFSQHDSELLDIGSVEYYVDGELRDRPLNTQCYHKLEGRFQLILGRPSLKASLQRSIEDKNQLKIAGFFISPLATANSVLTDKEKEQGCALVEFGAGITYLSVYKHKQLRYLTTIPLGGDVITDDICSLHVSKKEAENLKITYGNAMPDNESNTKIVVGQQTVDTQKLNTIIDARADEIIVNIVKQIELSGYVSDLTAGIVITGGASSLKNLRESLQVKSEKEVRLVAVKRALINQANDIVLQPENASVIGLLSLGEENCAKKEEPKKENKSGDYWEKDSPPEKPVDIPEKEEKKEDDKKEEPPVKKTKKSGIFSKWAGDLFGDD
ncbi:MAG: cell division protein FtsA [Dysgonamonadaceae bacterium]|jgi:cell division protein FtsA|nr:cell division protein FtsA [Dysgonamonadaceae bacterium]